jgi:hypothetical protein
MIVQLSQYNESNIEHCQLFSFRTILYYSSTVHDKFKIDFRRGSAFCAKSNFPRMQLNRMNQSTLFVQVLITCSRVIQQKPEFLSINQISKFDNLAFNIRLENIQHV